MKSLKIFVGLLLIGAMSALVLQPSFADSKTLSTTGASLSWVEPWYVDNSSCTVHDLKYSNTSGSELLGVYYSIFDNVGHEVGSDGVVGLSAGSSGVWVVRICAFIQGRLPQGLGPYTLRLKVDTYSSGTSQADALLTFTYSSTATPIPTPTVTVTAQPAPAPTVTVTAQPVPAPTVTVTAQPSSSQLSRLMSCLASAKRIIATKKGKLPPSC